MTTFRRRVRELAHRFGYDIRRWPDPGDIHFFRKRLLQRTAPDGVIDVGANIGQYARDLRDLGYSGWILSFEPLSSAFAELSSRSAHDKHWKVYNSALGNVTETKKMNVSANSVSSSLLPMASPHLSAAPDSRYIKDEVIQVSRLDGYLNEIHQMGRSWHLKIDSQGYEGPVLDGAGPVLDLAATVEVEMSLLELYEGQELMWSIVDRLRRSRFNPIAFFPEFADPQTNRWLQVQGVFEKF